MPSSHEDGCMPIAITLEPGTYYRCTCGKSKNLPFCDESHRGGTQLPLPFTLEQRAKVFLCACGKSQRQPFCDESCGIRLTTLEENPER